MSENIIINISFQAKRYTLKLKTSKLMVIYIKYLGLYDIDTRKRFGPNFIYFQDH